MIVLDASAGLELLLNTPRGAALQALMLDGETLHTPHLFDVEVLHVLRRLVLAKAMSRPRADEALADLGALDLTRYPHDVLRERTWALRASLSAYDATYVALAEGLRAPLYTADERLARAHGHRAEIRVL